LKVNPVKKKVGRRADEFIYNEIKDKKGKSIISKIKNFFVRGTK